MRKMIGTVLSLAVCVMLALLAAAHGAKAESDSDYFFDGEGTYYVIGAQLGANLTFSEGTCLPGLSNGRLSEKRDCTRFRFEEQGPNRYVIRPDCATNAYLTYGYAGQLVAEKDTGRIPDRGLWRVIPQQGGAQIVNVANGQRLVTYGVEPALKAASETEPVTSESSSLWLLVKTTCYGIDEQAQVRELQPEEKTVEKAITRSSEEPFCNLFNFSWGPLSRAEDFHFSVDDPEVLAVSQAGTITVNGMGEATITARHRFTGQWLTAKLHVSNNAIIIVPGFMGSELKNKDGDKIWSESLLNALSDGINLSALSKFKSLASPRSGDGVTAFDNHFGALDLTKNMYKMLSRTFGKDYTIEFYAYDWRRSSETTGSELARYLEGKNYDNIIFVTHSFGGLVCGQALAESETLREHTALLCMVGVPVNGTAGIAQAWAQDLFGNVLGLGSFGSMENSAIRKIICTLPSVYEMLPSVYAVEQLGTVGNCSSYSTFLSACAKSCSSFDKSLAEAAGRATSRLFIDGVSVFDMVPTKLFGGIGYDTATSVSVSGGKLDFSNTTDGDGVVSRSNCSAGLSEEATVEEFSGRHLWLLEEDAVLSGVADAIRATAE